MCSGIEFLLYYVGIVLVTGLSIATGTVAGTVGFLPLCALVVLRDARGGAFSLGKRIGSLRVVDAGTGLAASQAQGFGRNSYYIILLALMMLPAVEFLLIWVFKMLVFLDVLMILASPHGRRLGDFLAGTQVVAEARR